jgi:hypothetical protein
MHTVTVTCPRKMILHAPPILAAGVVTGPFAVRDLVGSVEVFLAPHPDIFGGTP